MKHLQYSALLIGVLLLAACAEPFSKQSYMEKYDQFMRAVATSEGPVSAEEWAERDATFSRFNGPWHDKFKDEFSWQDQVVLARYQFQYQAIKSGSLASSLIAESLREFNTANGQLQSYIESDMDKDMEFLLENASKAGETAETQLHSTLKELEKEAAQQPPAQ